MRALSVILLFLLMSTAASAETLWSISAMEEWQYSSRGHGVNIRGAYRYNNSDAVGLILRASFVPEDFRGGAAIAVHGALNFRHELSWTPGGGVTPFVGASLGVGFWTACVWPERCGGYGPSLGVEAGVVWPKTSLFRLITSIQADAHSSWFAGEETIPILSLNLGVEY